MLSPVLCVMSFGFVVYALLFPFVSLVLLSAHLQCHMLSMVCMSYMSYGATSHIICIDWYFLWLISRESGLFVLSCYFVQFLWLFLWFLWHFQGALCYAL